jgi:DNA-directed RNA polymerase specialized sigma24 family protein
MVIQRFYSRYADVLARAHLIELNDAVHEVFASLAKTEFGQVRNTEHYIMRAIKLHCWSLLDKAIRQKSRATVPPESTAGNDNGADILAQTANSHEHPTELDGMELLSNLSLFKAAAGERDARLLNLLIDETPRSEMARLLELNMNTLDTHIRRLRIRLVEYLRGLGYSYKAFERFT